MSPREASVSSVIRDWLLTIEPGKIVVQKHPPQVKCRLLPHGSACTIGQIAGDLKQAGLGRYKVMHSSDRSRIIVERIIQN